MMNELRDIAYGIIEDSITALNNEGRHHIDQILASITHQNYGDSKGDILGNMFSSAMQATHKKILEKAIANYQSKDGPQLFSLRYQI